MHKFQIGGLAGLMVSASANIYLLLHPTWVQQNPVWVKFIYAATAIISVLAVWQFFRGKPPDKVPTKSDDSSQRHSGTGDNVQDIDGGVSADKIAGSKLQATGDNSGAIQAGVYNEAPQPSARPAPPQSQLQIGIPSIRTIAYNEDLGVWENNADGGAGLLVEISYPRPPVGQSVPPVAKNISAVIDFSFNFGAYVRQVHRAYWFGKEANQADFMVDKKREVVVGIYSNSSWRTYENPREFVNHSDWHINTYAPLSPEIPISTESHIEFVLAIIDARHARTIAEQKFIVKALNGNWYTEAVL